MLNITDMKYRSLYQLYNDKPCINENGDACLRYFTFINSNRKHS
jgi:hypothetical protein